MKWSEIENDFYNTYDENQKVIRGFLLTKLGVDLENIPDIFFDTVLPYDDKKATLSAGREERVFLKNVVGTCYNSYGNISWIQSFQRLSRAYHYILQDMVTPSKYFRELKLPTPMQKTPQIPISFIKDGNKYYIYNNGNHRVIMYKLIYLSELSRVCNTLEVKKINNKYWLNAMVYTAL